jgi:hypothetical protein
MLEVVARGGAKKQSQGNVPIMKRLWNVSRSSAAASSCHSPSALRDRVVRGELLAETALLLLHPPPRFESFRCDQVVLAARLGHVDMVLWLEEKMGNSFPPFPVAHAALAHGHRAVATQVLRRWRQRLSVTQLATLWRALRGGPALPELLALVLGELVDRDCRAHDSSAPPAAPPPSPHPPRFN